MVLPKEDMEVLGFFLDIMVVVTLLRHCTASWKVMGLFPNDDIGIFH
jgi:hypothetical protein